tara:strand:- start:44603 stop:44722 length:120 start_codon:yes stop_codon:yes gene_type:complete
MMVLSTSKNEVNAFYFSLEFVLIHNDRHPEIQRISFINS